MCMYEICSNIVLNTKLVILRFRMFRKLSPFFVLLGHILFILENNTNIKYNSV